ncbi:LOW QUALITY PROTEIN: hypothetical protein PanWU01x14_240240 [Parasponia andersonii]|uniref:Uncharacterized protein n=1 Tax=Parasponia andersonii TaxID=3476 RepID=A0A2P5BGU9_PARAD|nr:LOW QUALITY PROTEIN: hypothetical protein PanWU01x14_240240 [Parasponia andersonii]
MSVWNGTLSQRRNLNPTRSRQGTPGMTNAMSAAVSHSAKFDPRKNYDVFGGLRLGLRGPQLIIRFSWAFALRGS